MKEVKKKKDKSGNADNNMKKKYIGSPSHPQLLVTDNGLDRNCALVHRMGAQ